MVSLSVYFALTVFVLPEKYIAKEQFVPSPYLEVELSSTEITLGESFRLSTISENKGDYMQTKTILDNTYQKYNSVKNNRFC